MTIFFVLIISHENELHNIKDKISDCYNAHKLREQQELFEAQYRVQFYIILFGDDVVHLLKITIKIKTYIF